MITRFLFGCALVILGAQATVASADTFTMQSGYYAGNGADNRAITGLGFTPNLVIIKDDTNNGAEGVVIKTSVMAAELSLALAETDAALTTNHIQSLDSDGFTIGNDADVNASNIGYFWTAYGGSDCSASGTFCVGSYVGNGTSQGITSVGFQPDLVVVKLGGAAVGLWKSSAMAGTVNNYFHAAAQLASGGVDSLDATGFSVGSNASVNTLSSTYYYFAFKQVAGAMDVGTYTGDGVDSRNITSADDAGLTFHPNFVFVKPTTAVGAVGSIREHYGDRSFVFDDNNSAANHVQGLRSAGGFQVGNSTSANTNTNTLYYAAFGGATTKAAGTGSFKVVSGTYTGTGASQGITGLGFTPDLVIVKNNAAQLGVFRTALMAGDRTAYLGSATTVFTLGITSLDADGFTVGTHATTNTTANTYYWTAFGNAMRMDKSGGSADFLIGQYIGTGIDSTDVDRLPIAPDFVAVKQVGTAIGVWRTSNQVGDLTLSFNAAAQVANYIQALNSDGFQRGTNAVVNTAGSLYDYFAFKSGGNFATGTYTGTGASQNITDAGLTPEHLWIKKTTGGTARDGILRTAAQAGDAAQPFTAVATVANAVTGLLGNGFTVNTATQANENTFAYQYAVWQQQSLDQADYRLFDNDNSADVGAALAAENTPASLAGTGAAFRLRQLLRVDNGNLPISSGSFKLQYVGKGTGSCAVPTGGTPAEYTDVSGATSIAFNNNASPADGATLTSNANDPVDGIRTTVNQSYEESNSFTNAQATISDGEDGQWDFSLIDNGAIQNEEYCFRVVRSDGAVLDSYSNWPEITTAPDIIAPTVDVTSSETSPTNNSPIPITIQFDESVTGFVVGDITVGNGSAGNFVAVDGDTYTADITPSADGAVTIDIASGAAQDVAANDNDAATQFSITYDTTGATVAISSSAGTATNTSPIPITVQFNESVTGFVIGDVVVGNGTAGNFAAVDGDTYTLDVTPSAEGAVTVDVASSVAIDLAGNDNSAAPQFSINYDTTDPTVSVSSMEVSPTSNSPFAVTIQFDQAVVGFAVGDLTVGNGSAGNFVAVDGDTYTADITPTVPGIVTVDVAGSVAQDAAGNDNTAATQFSITYDPTALSVSITSSETSPTNNSPIPITVQFNADVTGFVVGDITVGNGTAGNFAAVDGNTYTADITPTGDGVVTVDVAAGVAVDGLSNPNLAAPQFSITYDTTSPVPSISSGESSPTNESPIPITIQFDEPVTGFVVGDLIVGNGTAGSFVAVDGDTYTVDITPSAEGAVTVDIAANRALDLAGNNNDPATQFSITYDSVVPTVSITSTESSPTGVSPIPITMEFSETVTGFVIGDITVGNGSAGNFVAVDANTYTADITPSGTATVTVDIAGAVAQDGAGNNNSAATQFSIDYEEPPTLFTIQTGYYAGDGSDNRAITGLGFAPDMVIIKDDTAGGTEGAIFKTSTMAGELSLVIAEADANLTTDHIQSLDADGFTIGTDADVNGANVGFHWIAFGGSDCSATGTFCVGSYSGNGTSTVVSSVGFQPDLVTVKHSGTNLGIWKSSAMSGTNSNYFSPTAQLAANGITSLDATGFTVGSNGSVNVSANTYYYFAFKQVDDLMDVGTYAGNAADNRNITSANDAGLTFHPSFAFVKPITAVGAVASVREHYGDRSFVFDDNVSAANHIQGLRSAGGFQVGNSTSVNANLGTLYYAAFGGAMTKAAGSGEYTMATGTYSGNGTAQSISGLGFSPDLVIVKNNAAQQSVFRTSLMAGDRTAYLANNVTVFAGGVTTLDGDGFSVGANATVNTAANTYYWTAFGNAMRPDKSGGSADFLVGQYIGTADDSTNVDRLPIDPDLVAIKQVGTSLGVWRTSDQVGDQTLYFGATALATDFIQALNSDGFQKGTNAVVNGSGSTYDFFAFAAGSRFATGTYTGTGTSRNVTTGFQPEHLWIKKTTGGTARGGVLRTSSQTGDAAQPFAAVATVSNAITALLSNGFTTTTATETNENTFTYQYAAWDTKEYSQAGYRFFENDDSTDVGTPIATANTPATLGTANDRFRLRSLLRVDYGNLYLSNGSYKLQFAGKGTGSCAAPSGGTPASYTDVTTSTVIAYFNNPTPANADALTSNGGDPTDGGRTVVDQSYVESNNFSNSVAAIPNGQDGLWDVALVDKGVATQTTFCFRVVRSDGTVLETYTEWPELIVPADTVQPAVDITSSASDPTNVSPIPVTIEFSEDVTGFTVGDITVGNGGAGNFVAVDANTYTVDITPVTSGPVTVDIAGAVAQDSVGNDNTAAAQFSIVFGLRRRIISAS